MQKTTVFIVLLLIPALVLAQFSDPFDDGDFSANPPWVGDVEKFTVDNGVLRLNDNAAGQAYLSTESRIIHNTQWDFWVRLAFTPSNNNHPRIYLVSDNHDLSGPLNGYFLRIGKDGGDNKRLFFFRQDGTETTELMAGQTNLATTTNNRLRIRVIRDDEGNWEFFADGAGGFMFSGQGTAFDNTHTATSWFGIRCLYTITNSNRFYFDDFYVGEIIEDNDPPEVSLVQVTSSHILNVFFDEAVESGSAENPSNYFVDGGIGHPLIASRNPFTPNVVSLMFGQHFTANRVYNIRISHVEDYAGNAMQTYEAGFVYYVPQRFDVVFNELMVNPTPAVGLPAYEYIELYNTTDFPINLEGWVLQHGNSSRALPVSPLPAKGVLLLLTETALPFFQNGVNAVAVPGLSATALTNAGADLMLFDPGNNLVSFVSYTDQWYRDPSRSGGGWSLEKIDPYNFCQGANNWRASSDPKGGTPGLPNSVMAHNPDLDPPDLLRAGVEDDTSIVLHFSEPMNADYLVTNANYTINPLPGPLLSAEALLPDLSRVRLTFSELLQPGTIYDLVADRQITDCAGNPLRNNSVRFGLPRLARPSDVIINEVLFNPPDNGARYIEIYNRSDRLFDLKDYLLTSKDTITSFLTTIQEISRESYLFFPGDYMVLTPDPAAVKNTYMTPNPSAFIPMSGMPRMTNAGGIVVLATRSLQPVDMFICTDDMHLPLLTTYKGVSLERLNPDRPTQDRSNWHSAAQGAGFGTPAYRNSQYTLNSETEKGKVGVYPEVFSPDGDGHNDLLNISYTFEKPGYVANIRIFDSRGRLIRSLRRGELLATSGIITWDGITDDKQKAPVGIYLIHLEVFDLNGKVINYKNTAVLGGRF